MPLFRAWCVKERGCPVVWDALWCGGERVGERGYPCPVVWGIGSTRALWCGGEGVALLETVSKVKSECYPITVRTQTFFHQYIHVPLHNIRPSSQHHL